MEKKRSQIGILLKRNAILLINDIKRLGMLIGITLGIAFLIYFVCDSFEIYESMKTVVFICTVAPFFVGIFNSLMVIGQERDVVKREYLSFLSIPKYIIAHLLFQIFIVLIQSLVFTWIYWRALKMWEDYNTAILVFINTFLTMLAADALGLLLSATCKKQEEANLAAPFIIVVELVLSGTLFNLKGITKQLSYIMATRWGVSGLGSILDITSLPHAVEFYQGGLVAQAFPMLTQLSDFDAQAFSPTAFNILTCWLFLIVLIIVSVSLAMILLKRVKYDKRE